MKNENNKYTKNKEEQIDASLKNKYIEYFSRVLKDVDYEEIDKMDLDFFNYIFS